MKLKALKLRNVYVYDKLEFNFPVEVGIVFVKGMRPGKGSSSIGVGKSSLFESMEWIFFGDIAKEGAAATIVRHGARECYGNLTLGSYKFARRRGNHPFFRIGAKRYNASYGKTYVLKHLNLSPEIWNHAIYYPQMDTSRFTLATSAERKKFLVRLFNLDIFTECFDIEKGKCNKIRRKLDNIHSRIEVVRKLMERIRKRVKVDLKKERRKLKVLIEKRDKESAKCDEWNKILEGCNRKLRAVEDVFLLLVEKRKKLQKLIKRNKCPICGTIIEHRKKEFRSALQKIISKINKLNRRIKVYLKNVKKWGKMIIKAKGKIDDNRMEISLINGLVRSKKETKDTTDAKMMVGMNKIRIRKYEERRKIHEEAMEVFHRDGFPSHYIFHSINILNSFIVSVCNRFGFHIIPEILGEDYSIVVKIGKKKIGFKSCSGGEKRIVSVILFMAFYRIYRMMNAKNDVLDFIILDEPFSQMDRPDIKRMMNFVKAMARELGIVVYLITNDRWLVKVNRRLPVITVVMKGNKTKVIMENVQ